MKLALVMLTVTALGQLPYGLGMGPLCVGAQHAAMIAAQAPVEPPTDNPERRERQVPDGHWCQRAAPQMPAKAHACSCHSHDCGKKIDDPNSYSAHTDPSCKDFCHIDKCLCAHADCP